MVYANTKRPAKRMTVFAPMTLGNMRENGVRSLAITCGALWCHHEAVLDVTAFVDDVSVPSFGLRMVCTVCGAIGADARPHWNERAPPSLYNANRLYRAQEAFLIGVITVFVMPRELGIDFVWLVLR